MRWCSILHHKISILSSDLNSSNICDSWPYRIHSEHLGPLIPSAFFLTPPLIDDGARGSRSKGYFFPRATAPTP